MSTLSERIKQAKKRDQASLLDKCQKVIDVCRARGITPLSTYSSVGGSHVCMDREEFHRAFPENQGVEAAADGITFMCFED